MPIPFDRVEQFLRSGLLEQQRRGAGVERKEQQAAEPERERERRASAEHVVGAAAAARSARTSRTSRGYRDGSASRPSACPVVPEVNAIIATSSAAVSRRFESRRRWRHPRLESVHRVRRRSTAASARQPAARVESSRRRTSQSACVDLAPSRRSCAVRSHGTAASSSTAMPPALRTAKPAGREHRRSWARAAARDCRERSPRSSTSTRAIRLAFAAARRTSTRCPGATIAGRVAVARARGGRAVRSPR